MKRIIMMLIMAMAVTSFADISVNLDLMTLNDANDVAISEGIKFLAFVDKDNDGINGLDLSNYSDNNALWVAAAVANQGSFLWDADDAIVFNGASKGWGLDGYFSASDANGGDIQITLGNGIDENDHFYVMWFAELAGNAVAPGSISQVGFYTDSNWRLPAAPGLMTAASDTLNQSAITVVPEPASALLVAVGGAMVYALRRNTRKSIYIG